MERRRARRLLANTPHGLRQDIAWWVAALACRLPSSIAVYAVSPGGATATNVVRSAGPLS
jgi:hypothetical protein